MVLDLLLGLEHQMSLNFSGLKIQKSKNHRYTVGVYLELS